MDSKRFKMVNFTSIAISVKCPAGRLLHFHIFWVQSEYNVDGLVKAVMELLVLYTLRANIVWTQAHPVHHFHVAE